MGGSDPGVISRTRRYLSLVSYLGAEDDLTHSAALGLIQDTYDDECADHSDERQEAHRRGANCRLRWPDGDRRQCRRQRHQQEQDEDGYKPAHGTMMGAAFLIGRILAAFGAVLILGILVLNVLAFVNAENCGEPECDVEVNDVTHPSLALLPLAVFLGAAGVALIHDTYRKV